MQKIVLTGLAIVLVLIIIGTLFFLTVHGVCLMLPGPAVISTGRGMSLFVTMMNIIFSLHQNCLSVIIILMIFNGPCLMKCQLLKNSATHLSNKNRLSSTASFHIILLRVK